MLCQGGLLEVAVELEAGFCKVKFWRDREEWRKQVEAVVSRGFVEEGAVMGRERASNMNLIMRGSGFVPHF